MNDSWYSINHEAGIAHVFLRDEIGIGGKTASDFEIELCAHNPKNVSVTINSCGGNWSTGLALFGILQKWPTEVEIVGRCWSTGVLVAMAGQVIRIAPDATVLVHSPCNYVHGNSEEMRKAANEIEKFAKLGAGIICERTRQPEHIVNFWLSRDTYFSATEAISHGLADEMLTLPPPRAVGARKAESIRHAAPATTEAEQAFRLWLTAWGPLEVCDREKLGRELREWFASNVRQIEGDAPGL